MKQNGNRVRALILKETNDLIYEVGYKKTTLREICKRVGIVPGHLYFYFKKKEDILEAITMDFYAKLNIILKDHIHPDLDPLITFFIEKNFSNYIGAVIPELIMARKETLYLTNIQKTYIDSAAALLGKKIKQAGWDIPKETLIKSQAVAFGAEFTLEREAHEHGFTVGLGELIELYTSITLYYLNLDIRYLEQSIAEYNKLNKDEIVKRIYEMQDYDYALHAE